MSGVTKFTFGASFCNLCKRSFDTAYAYQAHVKTAKPHLYCETCDRFFATQELRDTHYRATGTHFHCWDPECSFDGKTIGELRLHWNESGCRVWCRGCGKVSEKKKDMTEHYKHHYVCQREGCGDHHKYPGALQKHTLLHNQGLLKCWTPMCSQFFNDTVALVEHIDSGQCEGHPAMNHLSLISTRFWPFANWMTGKPKYDGLQLFDQKLPNGRTVLFELWCPNCTTDGKKVTFRYVEDLLGHLKTPGECKEVQNNGFIKVGVKWLENALKGAWEERFG